MNKWLKIGGGVILAAAVILVVPGGIPLVVGVAKKVRDKHRATLAQAEEARVADKEYRLRLVAGC